MRLLVIFPTLLAAAIAAKLPSYSLPTPHQHQPSVGTALPVLPSNPSGPPPIQGHVGQNDLTQTYEPTGTHVLLQPNGSKGQIDLTQSFGGPTRPQKPLKFQGPTGQDVFIQTFGEFTGPQGQERPQHIAGQDILSQSVGGPTRPQGAAQTHRPEKQNGQTLTLVRPTGPNDVTQTYEEPEVLYGQSQYQGFDGQAVFGGHAVEPQSPTQSHIPVGPVLGGRCLQGEVLHADGSCVVPEVTRDVYIFTIPETPRRPRKPLPSLPPPRVHEHVMFIRAPEDGNGPEPLLVPPPAQKSVVYVLRKESNDETPRLIQAPAPPPARPEVFFINYEDGDNPSLPGGYDLQQVLQTAAQATPSPLGVAPSDDLVESPEKIYSGPGGYSGDNIVQEDHNNGDFALGVHSHDGITLGGHSDSSPALGGHSGGNLLLGSINSDNLALKVDNEESFGFVKHIDDDLSLEGHSDDDFILEGHTDDDTSLGHSDDDFVLGDHGDDYTSLESHNENEFGLRGHNNGNVVLGGQSNNGILLEGPTNIALNIPGDESSAYGLNGEASTGFGILDGDDLGSDHTQEEGEGGYAVPARLLSASLGNRVGSFNGFTNGKEETAARGDETVSVDAATRFSGPLYGPPTSPAAPVLHYAQP